MPIAIWLAVRWALIVPAIELEGSSARAALRRSGRLVRHGWLKVASLIVVGAALAIVAGPFLGALLILATSVPLALINVIAGLVYAVAMPFVALTYGLRLLRHARPRGARQRARARAAPRGDRVLRLIAADRQARSSTTTGISRSVFFA